MATYRIAGRRWLRKYTAPQVSPVYAASVDARTVVESLCDVPWKRVFAKDARMTYHTDEVVSEDPEITGLDMNVRIRDHFDAALFCAGHVGGQHRAFANVACYRYTMPDEAVGKSVSALNIQVTSDPYNSQGVRLHTFTNTTGEIPMNCRVLRGEDAGGEIVDDGTTAAGVAPRTTETRGETDYWYPTMTTVTLAPSGGMVLQRYLFIVVALESYSTVRGNWLEGSSFIKNAVEIETTESISGWTDGETIDLASDGEGGGGWEIVRDGHLPPRKYKDAEDNFLETGIRYLTVQNDGTKYKGEMIRHHVTGLSGEAGRQFLFSGVAHRIQFPHQILNVFDQSCDWAFIDKGVIDKWITLWEPVVAVSGQGGDCLFPELGVHISDLEVYDNSVKVTGLDPSLVAAATQGITAVFAKAHSGSSSTSEYPLDVYVFTKGGGSLSPIGTMTIAHSTRKCTGFTKNPSYSFDSSLLVDFAVPYMLTPYTQGTYVEGVNGMAFLRVANGKITAVGGADFFPSGGIGFVGTVRQIHGATIDRTSTSLRFTVTGELTSVGGVACSSCAYVEVATGGEVTVMRPYFDAGLSFANPSAATVVRRGENAWVVTSAGAITYSGITQNGVMELGKSGLLPNSSLNRDSAFLHSDSSCIGASPGLVVPFRLYGYYDIPYMGYPFRVEDATDAQVVNGLRTLFARFECGEMEAPTSNKADDFLNERHEWSYYDYGYEGEDARSGVAFSLHFATVTLKIPVSETGYTDKSVRFLGIGSSVLVVPFSNPGKGHYSTLHLDWSKCDGVTVTPEARVNVWFKPSYMSEVYPDCSHPALYNACQKTVDGWTLVGTFSPANGTSVDFDFAADDYQYGSFMLTAFIDVSEIKTTDNLAEFVGLGRMVHNLVDSSSGCDVTFPSEERVFIPDMELI